MGQNLTKHTKDTRDEEKGVMDRIKKTIGLKDEAPEEEKRIIDPIKETIGLADETSKEEKGVMASIKETRKKSFQSNWLPMLSLHSCFSIF